MSEREDIRGDETQPQPQGAAPAGDSPEKKADLKVGLREGRHANNYEDSSEQATYPGKKRRLLGWRRWKSPAPKGKHVNVTHNVGLNESASKTVGKYRAALIWEHGRNNAVISLFLIIAYVLAGLYLMIVGAREGRQLSPLSELGRIRAKSRDCLSASGDALNACPYGFDGSVAMGLSMLAGMLGVEALVFALLCVQSYRGVKRKGRGGTVATYVFDSWVRSWVFWFVVALSFLVGCSVLLIWWPSASAFEAQLPLALLSVVPMLASVVASVVVPVFLYVHVVDYGADDVHRRWKFVEEQREATLGGAICKVGRRRLKQLYGEVPRESGISQMTFIQAVCLVAGVATAVGGLVIALCFGGRIAKWACIVSVLAFSVAVIVLYYAWQTTGCRAWERYFHAVMVALPLVCVVVLVGAASYALRRYMSDGWSVFVSLFSWLVLSALWLIALMGKDVVVVRKSILPLVLRPITLYQARWLVRTEGELDWLREQQVAISARDVVSESPAADIGIGGESGSERLEEGSEFRLSSRSGDNGQPPVAERESVTGEEGTVHGHGRRARTRTPYRGGMIGLAAGVLLVLGAGRLKSTRRK
ncbi:MAG: hypothetical protein E7Z95_04460 [Actinomyces succiniciruminis]|nr:hypothetical protein [Actinomyces succiniciruminis]